MIMATADDVHARRDESVVEMRVKPRGRDAFAPLADEVSGFLVVRRRVAVFREGNMDESHIEMNLSVVLVRGAILEFLRFGSEPVDLFWLEPVVAAEVALVGGVRVRVEEVEGQGGVLGVVRGREDVDVVVADAFDGVRAGLGEGVGEGFDEGHLGGAGEDAFVVVVAEDGGVGDVARDEEVGVFEDGLMGGLVICWDG